jgi:FixJ family two-component response regulator
MPRQRIFVCDDNPTLQGHIEQVLVKAGFKVQTTESQTAAAAFLNDDEPPALVLLGGWSRPEIADPFFEALRTNGAGVVVVGLGLPEPGSTPDVARRPREIVDVLPRPFSPEALVAVVEHALEKGDRARDPAAPEAATDLGSLSLVPTGPLPAPASEAALAGDLAVISLADVLGLLDAEGQTGTLTIRRADAHLEVHFASGRIELATAAGISEDFLLGRFLVRGGALAAPTLATALAARDAEPGPRPLLGAFLVERGYVGPPALRRVLALQSAALIFESLRWGGGRFEFHMAELPATARDAGLNLAVPPLLLEGFRRVDEWRLIEREVGDFDGVFLRDEDRLTTFGRARLTREEGAVLDLCDGRRTVREIVTEASRRPGAAVHMSAFDTTKMLYRLSRTRLIRRRVAPVAMPA